MSLFHYDHETGSFFVPGQTADDEPPERGPVCECCDSRLDVQPVEVPDPEYPTVVMRLCEKCRDKWASPRAGSIWWVPAGAAPAEGAQT